MLVEVDVLGGEGAYVAVHCEVEGGVVPFDGFQKGSYGDVGVEFFTDFAYEGFLWGFARFDFSSGELPPALPLSVPALGGEDFSIFDDDCCDYLDGLHR